MLNGLWKLTWLEIKVFLREPLGVVGTLGVPLVVVAVMGRLLSDRAAAGSPEAASFTNVRLPVFAAILVALGEVVSLVTIISLYRESGILKRLRATPLRPLTILTAHVLVKLLLTAVTLGLVLALGQRYYPVPLDYRLASFTLALLFSTCSILSLGFLVASVVPTARFAQPVASLLLWPMVALSGLFMPLEAMPALLRYIAGSLPLTYAASLMQGIWTGDTWMQHLGDVFGLTAVFVVCAALSAKVFRWE